MIMVVVMLVVMVVEKADWNTWKREREDASVCCDVPAAVSDDA